MYDYSFLTENCPEDKQRDLDYVMSLLDWDKNVDPHYRKNNFRPPLTVAETAKGVTIENHSSCEPLVMLKHFPVYDGVPQ